VRRTISLTGQFAALDKNLTARENLVLMARLRGHAGAGAAVADELIERFDSREFRDRSSRTSPAGSAAASTSPRA
jgi:ABC-2 type transport system ATP-binding protein